jgi:hypothetical protein
MCVCMGKREEAIVESGNNQKKKKSYLHKYIYYRKIALIKEVSFSCLFISLLIIPLNHQR